jgi:hypothetical protein
MTSPESKKQETDTTKENLQELGTGELVANIAWICASTKASIDQTWRGVEPPYCSRGEFAERIKMKGEFEIRPYVEELNRRFPVTSQAK